MPNRISSSLSSAKSSTMCDGGCADSLSAAGHGNKLTSRTAARVRALSPPASTTKSTSPRRIWPAVILTSVCGMLPPCGVVAYSCARIPHAVPKAWAAFAYFHDNKRTTRIESTSLGSVMPASSAAAVSASAISATGCLAVAGSTERSSTWPWPMSTGVRGSSVMRNNITHRALSAPRLARDGNRGAKVTEANCNRVRSRWF